MNQDLINCISYIIIKKQEKSFYALQIKYNLGTYAIIIVNVSVINF